MAMLTRFTPYLACDDLELVAERSWVPAGVMGDLDE